MRCGRMPVPPAARSMHHTCLLPPLRPRHPSLQENKLGQKFVVDATLQTDLSRAGHSDDVAHTVNYAEVYE